MTTQSLLLDFSIPADRDIAQSQQIVEDLLNQKLRTLNQTFSCLKLQLNITGRSQEKEKEAVAVTKYCTRQVLVEIHHTKFVQNVKFASSVEV